MKTINRPDWDTYFMEIAKVTKSRGNCLLRQEGAVIVKDRRIIATGYNGTPMGVKNCLDGGCKRCLKRSQGKLKHGEQSQECICIHAEQNAILQSAYHGTSTDGASIYTTTVPCNECAKLIANAGIKKVVSRKHYDDSIGHDLLKRANIEVVVLSSKR